MSFLLKSNLAILLFFISNVVFAKTYQYIDGNGNVYTVNEQPRIEIIYEPITAEQSSSGFYSGGKRRNTYLSERELHSLESLIQKIPKSYLKEIPRNKGVSTLIRRGGSKSLVYFFPYDDIKAKELLDLLNNLSHKEKNQQEDLGVNMNRLPSQLIGKVFEMERGENPFPDIAPDGVVDVNDSELFGELRRIDVTLLDHGQTKKVGTYKKDILETEDQMLTFLLKSQILITFIHTNSVLSITDVYLDPEDSDKVIYKLEGNHFYYTNKKNTKKLSFSIIFRKKTKEILVKGNK